MQSFPKPMSAKEERECIIRCKSGDSQARAALIEHNLRLVAYIAKKYNTPDQEMDDLISIGTIGLIKGIDSFDMDKNIRLATYAARCIENELLMQMRANRKKSKDVYLYESIGSDKEGNEISLIDIIEFEDEDVAERMTTEGYLSKLEGYMKDCLSTREQDIIRMRYGIGRDEEMTQREIGKKYGISRSYVSRIEKKALYKLRGCYEKHTKIEV